MSRIVLALLVLCGLCAFAQAEAPGAIRANEAGADRKAVESLASKLGQAIPGSRINVIPNGADAVILAGFVPKAEDRDAASAAAKEAGFEVVNALRLEDARQIRLDVVVIEVREGERISLDTCKARYAKRFGRDPEPVAPSPKRRDPWIVGIVPGWVKKAFVSDPPAEKLSQEHLDGILDPQQHEPFLAFLQAQENVGHAKLLCRPRMITLSGRSARWGNGCEPPVPPGPGSIGIQFEDYGGQLDCLPTVLRDDQIRVDCEAELSLAPWQPVSRITKRHKRLADLKPGQSLVMGGEGWIVLVTPMLLTPEAGTR